jgi:hypothetical protein
MRDNPSRVVSRVLSNSFWEHHVPGNGLSGYAGPNPCGGCRSIPGHGADFCLSTIRVHGRGYAQWVRPRRHPERDVICGRGGRDTIRARSGDDVIVGGDRNDYIWGGSGSDTVHGEYGSDKIDGGPRNDQIRGGPDDDLVLGNGGSDVLEGMRGKDELYGGRRDDAIRAPRAMTHVCEAVGTGGTTSLREGGATTG